MKMLAGSAMPVLGQGGRADGRHYLRPMPPTGWLGDRPFDATPEARVGEGPDVFRLAVVGGGPRATYALERLSATIDRLGGNGSTSMCTNARGSSARGRSTAPASRTPATSTGAPPRSTSRPTPRCPARTGLAPRRSGRRCTSGADAVSRGRGTRPPLTFGDNRAICTVLAAGPTHTSRPRMDL